MSPLLLKERLFWTHFKGDLFFGILFLSFLHVLVHFSVPQLGPSSFVGLSFLLLMLCLFFLSDGLLTYDLQAGYYETCLVGGQGIYPSLCFKLLYASVLWGGTLWATSLFWVFVHMGGTIPLEIPVGWILAIVSALPLILFSTVVTHGAPHQKALLSFLVFPFLVPLFLILQQLHTAALQGHTPRGYFLMLGGLTFIYLPLGIIGSKIGLKIAIEEK